MQQHLLSYHFYRKKCYLYHKKLLLLYTGALSKARRENRRATRSRNNETSRRCTALYIFHLFLTIQIIHKLQMCSTGKIIHHLHALPHPTDRRLYKTARIWRSEASRSCPWGKSKHKKIITFRDTYILTTEIWILSVGESSSESKHAADGNNTYSFRQHPRKPWRGIAHSRQSSCCKWFVYGRRRVL